MDKNSKILITGATGFIGRNLVCALNEKGYNNIWCLVRATSPIDRLKEHKLNFIYGDITDAGSLDKISISPDVIFHCAGCVENKNRAKLWQVNVHGADNICRLAMRLKVKRLIYTSSVAVVTGNDQVPLDEDLPYKATNLYGESKLQGEKIVVGWRDKGLAVAIIRPCMVYGEGEPHLLKLLLRLLRLRLFPIISQGKSRFHMVYVKNVVQSMIFAASNDQMLRGSFFIADKEAFTAKEVFTTFALAIGAPPPWDFPRLLTPLALKVPRVGKQLQFFQKDRLYSIRRLAALGFSPPYPAKESLAQTAQSFHNTKKGV